jgi:hypothetical protein
VAALGNKVGGIETASISDLKEVARAQRMGPSTMNAKAKETIMAGILF